MNSILLTSKSSIGSCKECIHIIDSWYSGGKCKAFPGGIPKDLFWNSHFHTTIMPKQEGEYIFEMKERYKKVYEKIEKNENKKPIEISEDKELAFIYKNINADNIDTFCSILGKEVLFEYKGKSYLMIPCFNVGFYENVVNPEKITKSVDYSLFLFEDIFKVNISLGIYKDQKHTEFFDKRICYDVIYKDITEKEHRNFYLEGFCHRGTSNSYASYKIFSESVHLIIMNNKELKEYKSGIEEFDSNESIKDFLAFKQLDIGFLQSIIETIL